MDGVRLTDHPADRRLDATTRPLDRPNPVPADRYDVVVLGAGAAGLVAAGVIGSARGRVAIVEGAHIGGDCTVSGCVPSKALVDLARRVHDARDGVARGWLTGEVAVDGAAVLAEVRERRARIGDRESIPRFEALGMDVFLGRGTFRSPHEVDVRGHDGTTTTLHFDRAILAHGSVPNLPPIDGLAELAGPDGPVHTNETIFDLPSPPASMVVIGAGPIGCELGQAFARLGTEVTIIEAARRVLPRDDQDAAAIVDAALRADGIRLHTATQVRSVTAAGAGVRVEARELVLDADCVLVAAGRSAPPDPGLAALGVDVADDGFPIVDDRMRTSAAHVHAVGDVALRTKFTHMANASAQTAVTDLLSPVGGPGLDQAEAPWVTFTTPAVGHVGLTLEDARRRDEKVQTITVDLADVDKSVVTGDDAGFVRLHLSPVRKRIVGATVVSNDAEEMVSLLATARAAGMGLLGLSTVVHPYPTMSSAYQEAAQEVLGPLLGQLGPVLDAYWRFRRR